MFKSMMSSKNCLQTLLLWPVLSMMLEMSADTVTVTCFECDVLLEIFADTVILACIECDVRNICRHRYCGLFWV